MQLFCIWKCTPKGIFKSFSSLSCDKDIGYPDNSPPGQFAPDNSPPIFRQLAPNLQTTRPQYENPCVSIRISSLPRVQCKVSNSASEVLQEEAVWPWWHQASEVSDLKNMHNFDSKIYNIELLILISLLVKFILMGDSFFVINWMRAFWEHLHSKVCSYARLCKVVLIFKSVNGTLLMRKFHIVRIAKRRVLYRFFKWNLNVEYPSPVMNFPWIA